MKKFFNATAAKNEASRRAFFQGIRVGTFVTYPAQMSCNEVIRAAQSVGVGLQYCGHTTPGYAQYGSRCLQVYSIAP